MKKNFFLITTVVLTVLLAFLIIAPGLVERSMNRTIAMVHEAPSDAAVDLHQRLVIADLHADTLLWQRSLTRRASRGHVDLPRLQAGNVALQVFSSVTRTPAGQNYESNAADSDNLVALAIVQRQPLRTWRSPFQRSLWHAERLAHAARGADDLTIIGSRSDLAALLKARADGRDLVGALLSIEGLHNLEGDAGNLKRLFDVGYRMAGLTHFFDNRLAGSMHGEQKGGLTTFGREIVGEMQRLGMVVDIAHLSPAAIDDVLAMATRPVVVSHGGVKALCDVNRNLTDTQIRGVAVTGGVVGIGYWSGAICEPSPARVAEAILHVIDVAGIDHVGLGSDFDGAVAVSFDTSQLVLVTDALLDAGLSEAAIRQIMGGNVLRLLAQTLPP